MNRPFIAFHFGLVQDVAVLRPLVRLAAEMPSHDVHLLVADTFAGLDPDGRWMAEISRVASTLGIEPLVYASSFDVLRHLGSGSGIIVAGSESNVRAHAKAHELFQSMPGRIRTITLQHGFECVGFLHNKRHDATAGRDVKFAADIVVGWFDRDQLHAVSASERSKVFVAGPPSLVDKPARAKAKTGIPRGLICENLHSVRFVNGRLRESFIEAFLSFAGRLAMIGEGITLRPHPAGQFTKRTGLALPDNVEVSEAPIYALDLASFSYVISAPSTILFDFAVAGVPAATWVDPDGMVDSSNYEGLAQVASVDDWWRFHWAARWSREALLDKQQAYLAGLKMPKDIRGRYRQLLAVA
jgi:hypothetical protein